MSVSVPFGSDDSFLQGIDKAMLDRTGSAPRCAVTMQLDESWEARISLGEQDGAPVVERVEIRHNPYHLGYADPETQKVTLAPLPKGGLPLRLLRSITFGGALAAGRESLASVSDDTLKMHGFSRQTLDEPRRPGRRGHGDRYYAEIAAAYVLAVERGSPHPVEDVAKEWGEGFSAAYIRAALHRARGRELLTKMGRGVAGGTLTRKAKSILNPRLK